MTIRGTKRLVTTILVLLVLIDLACVGVLLSPYGKSPQARTADLRVLQNEFKDRETAMGGAEGMPGKLANARKDISNFYDQRLSGQYSQIDSSLDKAATANGVQLASVNYKADLKPIEDLERVAIDITISGPYVNDVKFINAMERDKVFFVIDSVSLVGSQHGVQLLVRAETYFRMGAA
ncbi:MAG TPA: hypothetical protein VGL89_08425 [Candidatus Koribacter sp.]|jgi:type IV pilus assembly protein PilO